MPDSRGANVLFEYVRILLSDHAKQEDIYLAGRTWEDYRTGVAALLRDSRAEYKPACKKALLENANLPEDLRHSPKAVKAGVRRALEGKAQRAWEDANWKKAEAEPLIIEELLTPFDVAVSNLVRWIDVPGIDEEQLREYLASVPWGGPTERTKLVAELERLDREGYVYLLAESIKEKCPKGATRISEHPKPPVPFVPNEFQRAILKALDGRALKKLPLAGEVCGGEGSRLYRKDGIKELMAAGKVYRKDRLGYYRPDAPPPSS